MVLVYLVTREPRTRDAIAGYLRDRGYDTATGTSYDEAMEALGGQRVDAVVVDVQGVPRGEQGANFSQFSQWMATEFAGKSTACVYLLHKGARRPHFRLEGPVIKKPFPIEALGEALRVRLGHPRQNGAGPGLDLDLATNTLRSVNGETRLTNIEATLLAYLMAHQGEILHPKNLLVDVWQYSNAAGANTLVRAHVSNLRRKLRVAAGSDQLIQTVRGKGYRFIA